MSHEQKSSSFPPSCRNLFVARIKLHNDVVVAFGAPRCLWRLVPCLSFLCISANPWRVSIKEHHTRTMRAILVPCQQRPSQQAKLLCENFEDAITLASSTSSRSLEDQTVAICHSCLRRQQLSFRGRCQRNCHIVHGRGPAQFRHSLNQTRKRSPSQSGHFQNRILSFRKPASLADKQAQDGREGTTWKHRRRRSREGASSTGGHEVVGGLPPAARMPVEHDGSETARRGTPGWHGRRCAGPLIVEAARHAYRWTDDCKGFYRRFRRRHVKHLPAFGAASDHFGHRFRLMARSDSREITATASAALLCCPLVKHLPAFGASFLITWTAASVCWLVRKTSSCYWVGTLISTCQGKLSVASNAADILTL